jgi:hypothetical protein
MAKDKCRGEDKGKAKKKPEAPKLGTLYERPKTTPR